MNYKEILEEIVRDVSYKTEDGIPNWKNPQHVTILSEVLDGSPLAFTKTEIIRELINESDSDAEKDGYRGYGGSYVKTSDFGSDGKPRPGSDTYSKEGNLYRKIGKFEDSETEKVDPDDVNSKSGDDVTTTNQPTPESEPDPISAKSAHEKFGEEHVERAKKEADAAKQDTDHGKTELSDSELMHTASKITNGKLSVNGDPFGDTSMESSLKHGFKEVGKFKPAPGNAASMFTEIMSGEVMSHLNENPDMSESELINSMLSQLNGTGMAKQFTDKKLKELTKISAKSGIVKHNRTQDGIEKLTNLEVFEKPVKIRNYYGSSVSIGQQIKLVNAAKGKVFTRTGDEIPKSELIELISNSGGGDNPSDTSTITTDSNGNLMVEFHSDKTSTADIQANSTPNKEMDDNIKLIENTNMNDLEKSAVIQSIRSTQSQLKKKEDELKTAGSSVADDMFIDGVHDRIKNLTRLNSRDSKRRAALKTSIKSRIPKLINDKGIPHQFISSNLPEQDGPYSDAQLVGALLKSYSEPSKWETQPTSHHVKMVTYMSQLSGLDIGGVLSDIREESIQLQQELHSKLNERSITLENGNSKSLGDYIESKNIISKLHLDVIDSNSDHGVAQFDGLFNVNMGGTIVESKQLKLCLGIESTDDITDNLQIGEPDASSTFTRDKEGNVTGRKSFVYMITKSGKRVPFAYKTDRSKQGQTGKLNTTYQFSKDAQNCFKKNQ